jgi:hypothetical protein
MAGQCPISVQHNHLLRLKLADQEWINSCSDLSFRGRSAPARGLTLAAE